MRGRGFFQDRRSGVGTQPVLASQCVAGSVGIRGGGDRRRSRLEAPRRIASERGRRWRIGLALGLPQFVHRLFGGSRRGRIEAFGEAHGRDRRRIIEGGGRHRFGGGCAFAWACSGCVRFGGEPQFGLKLGFLGGCQGIGGGRHRGVEWSLRGEWVFVVPRGFLRVVDILRFVGILHRADGGRVWWRKRRRFEFRRCGAGGIRIACRARVGRVRSGLVRHWRGFCQVFDRCRGFPRFRRRTGFPAHIGVGRTIPLGVGRCQYAEEDRHTTGGNLNAKAFHESHSFARTTVSPLTECFMLQELTNHCCREKGKPGRGRRSRWHFQTGPSRVS